MELEINWEFWQSGPGKKKGRQLLAVGWALLELSLEDPDYGVVLQELKSGRQAPPRALPVQCWN